MTYTIAYDNFNMILENCIGTWSGEKMPASYTITGADGKPYTGWTYNYRNGEWVSVYATAPMTYTNFEVEHPRAIFGNDDVTGKSPVASMLGCLAYIQPTDVFPATALIYTTGIDYVNIADTIASIPPGYFLATYPFNLTSRQVATPPVGHLTASHITSIGAVTSSFETVRGGNAQWVITDAVQEASNSAFHSSIYLGLEGGAKLCYRYVDGVLTTTPLWPWPMNDRIKAAMILSGRTSVDVTQTVTGILGSIPDNCGGSQTPPTLPPRSPINLHIK